MTAAAAPTPSTDTQTAMPYDPPRDTRLVLAYPGVLAVPGAVGAVIITLEVLGVR